jgi:hypothetical protein
MERLKAILADKILDLSAGSGDDVKAKIDKIQRFRDFANACKTLMNKYPGIEDELINMAEDGDFDARVASSRVDTAIRLADAEVARMKTAAPRIGEQIKEPEIPEEIPDMDDIPMEVCRGEEEEPAHQPEDIEYEELQPSPGEEAEPEYAEAGTQEVLKEETGEEGYNMFPNEEELAAAKRKVNIRRIVQIIGAALVVGALIFIVKFVMVHWQTILIIAGILIVLAILSVCVWAKRKRS